MHKGRAAFLGSAAAFSLNECHSGYFFQDTTPSHSSVALPSVSHSSPRGTVVLIFPLVGAGVRGGLVSGTRREMA